MDTTTSPTAQPTTTTLVRDAEDRGPLLAWQLRLYPAGHADRLNLLLHLATVPLFWLGAAALVAAPFASPWWALPGLAAMATAMAVQGRGHRREQTAPVAFRGARDAVVRILAEQLVTFPRFVLGGGLFRALRASRRGVH